MHETPTKDENESMPLTLEEADPSDEQDVDGLSGELSGGSEGFSNAKSPLEGPTFAASPGPYAPDESDEPEPILHLTLLMLGDSNPRC